jgi:hypothetical protein
MNPYAPEKRDSAQIAASSCPFAKYILSEFSYARGVSGWATENRGSERLRY